MRSFPYQSISLSFPTAMFHKTKDLVRRYGFDINAQVLSPQVNLFKFLNVPYLRTDLIEEAVVLDPRCLENINKTLWMLCPLCLRASVCMSFYVVLFHSVGMPFRVCPFCRFVLPCV